MKRLDEHSREKITTNEKADPEKKSLSNSGIFCLPIVMNRQEAIDKKIERLQGKILGWSINKLTIGKMRDVWVPYGYYIYHFEIGKKSGPIKLHRDGELHIIYDMNERHCVQYDQEDGKGPLQLKKRNFEGDERPLLKSQADKEQAMKDVESYIQRKIMAKTFGKSGDLKLKKHIQFYRPAVELEVFFKNENCNIRYAYLDEYAVTSEHILGMKYRITQ